MIFFEIYIFIFREMPPKLRGLKRGAKRKSLAELAGVDEEGPTFAELTANDPSVLVVINQPMNF